MPKVNNVQIHTYVDKDDNDNFQRLYSDCRSRFIKNCIKLAVNDKIFFEYVFFKDTLFKDSEFVIK